MSDWKERFPWNAFQNWLTSSLFALVLMYFISRLAGVMPHLLPYVGLSLVFCGLIGLSVRFWKVSGIAALVIVLLLLIQVLFGMRWNIPLIGFGWWSDVVSSAAGCLKWAMTWNTEKGGVPQNAGLFLCLACCALASSTIWALPIPLLNMALLILPLFYLDDVTKDPAWIAWLLAGLFCVYASYAYRQDPSDREQRAPVLFGLALIGLTFVLQIVVPPETFFIPELSRLMNDVTPTVGGEITSFSLESLGFYPQGGRQIGGTPQIVPDPFLDVEAGKEPFYLRGASFDLFDGSTWQLSEPQNLMEFESRQDYLDTFDTEQAKVFWFPSAKARDIALEGHALLPLQYRIQALRGEKYVFNGGHPVLAARSEKPLREFDEFANAAINQHGDFLFSENGTLISKAGYQNESIELLDSVAVPDDKAQLENLAMLTKDFPATRKQGPRKYEKLVRAEDPELASLLYDGERPLPELIRGMRKRMDDSYRYTIDMPPLQKGEFLKSFLRDKKGYCVYFATAWSLLLSDIGYEVRYAEGFVVPAAAIPDDALSVRTLTGTQAHAWTEIHLSGFGWYPLEATPTQYLKTLANLSALQDQKDEPQQSSEQSSSSEESSSSEQVSSEETAPKPELPKQNSGEEGLGILFMLLAAVLAALIARVAYCAIRRRRRATMRFSGMDESKRAETARAMLKRLWKICSLKLMIGNKDTVRTMISRWNESVPEAAIDEDVMTQIERFRYGGKAPDSKELAVWRGEILRAERAALASKKAFHKFLMMYLLDTGHPW